MDRANATVYLPVEPLYAAKMKVYSLIRQDLRGRQGRALVTDYVELPSHTDAHLVGFDTLGRDEVGAWAYSNTSPVERAVNAAGPLGLPGGPCHIIRDIEQERLPDKLKQELVEDIEKGKSLSNSDADKIYKPKRVPAKKIHLFRSIFLTSHAQYRMNLRGVTEMELQGAFNEFGRWFAARKQSDKIKPKDQRLMSDLAYGEAVRFEANRIGLTVVFAVDSRRKEARLVSCWWTGQENPPRPTPGQCDFIPYLDKDREERGRPAILGSAPWWKDADDGYMPQDEMYLIPDDHEHEDDFVDAAALSDPASFYETDLFEDIPYDPVRTHPDHVKDEGFSFNLSPSGTDVSVGDRDRTADWEEWSEGSDWDEDDEEYEYEYEYEDEDDFDDEYGDDEYEDDDLDDEWYDDEGEDEDSEVDAIGSGNKYYGPRPVNPRNRQKNRSRRRDYSRSPGKRRDKKRKDRRYRRLPGTKRKRKLQRRRRKQRGRG
jgi:hypothetical protein